MKYILALLLSASLAFAGTLDDIAATKPKYGTNATGTLRVASATQDGETVTIGSTVFEIDTHSTATITAGRQRVNLSGGSTATAVATLTSSGNFTDTQTVVIGGKTYTSQTTLTNVDGNFLIGADRTASHANLKAAVNREAGSGTLYAAATVLHPTVTATSANATTTVFAAKTPGTVGNALGSTETQTNASFGGSTFASGVDPTAGETTTALNTAINATNVLGFTVSSARPGANEIVVWNRNGSGALATTETLAGSNNAWGAATMVGGTAGAFRVANQTSRAATATEVAVGNAHFVFPYTPASVIVSVRTAAGAAKAWDGTTTITGQRVTLNNSGSTSFAATDVLTILAAE